MIRLLTDEMARSKMDQMERRLERKATRKMKMLKAVINLSNWKMAKMMTPKGIWQSSPRKAPNPKRNEALVGRPRMELCLNVNNNWLRKKHWLKLRLKHKVKVDKRPVGQCLKPPVSRPNLSKIR